MLQVQPTLDARDGSDLDDSDASRGLLLTSTLHCPSLSDGAPLRDRTVQGMGCTCVAIRLFFCFRSLHLWRKREGRGRRLRWCVRLIRVRGEHMRVSPSVRSHTHNKRHLTDSRAAHDPLLSTHTHQHARTPFHPPPHERANPPPPPDTHVMHILCGVPRRPV